jgi:hypothetical protein
MHMKIVQAQRLYKDLKNTGLNPWLDEQSLLPGQRWESQIKEAMGKSRYFITVLSRNSVVKKGYVQKEIKAALDILEEVQKSDVYVIPVRIDEIEIADKKLRGLHFGPVYAGSNLSPVSACPKAWVSISVMPLVVTRIATDKLTAAKLVVKRILLFLLEYIKRKYFHNYLMIMFCVVCLVATIGIEKIISGIYSAGKGRRSILVIGILILLFSVLAIVYPSGNTGNGLGVKLLILAIAIVLDGIARIYFGKVNRTTRRPPRILYALPLLLTCRFRQKASMEYILHYHRKQDNYDSPVV